MYFFVQERVFRDLWPKNVKFHSRKPYKVGHLDIANFSRKKNTVHFCVVIQKIYFICARLHISGSITKNVKFRNLLGFYIEISKKILKFHIFGQQSPNTPKMCISWITNVFANVYLSRCIALYPCWKKCGKYSFLKTSGVEIFTRIIFILKIFTKRNVYRDFKWFSWRFWNFEW